MSYPLPKMSTMISNATQAAKVVSRDALRHGKFKADPELKKSRLSFCHHVSIIDRRMKGAAMTGVVVLLN
jgi:hypothetical protein